MIRSVGRRVALVASYLAVFASGVWPNPDPVGIMVLSIVRIWSSMYRYYGFTDRAGGMGGVGPGTLFIVLVL